MVEVSEFLMQFFLKDSMHFANAIANASRAPCIFLEEFSKLGTSIHSRKTTNVICGSFLLSSLMDLAVFFL